MAKQREQQEEPASWLATFADLATLLFTFYCLIYASCTYRPGQWETANSALERAFSVLRGNSSSSLVDAVGDGALPASSAIVATLQTGVGLSSSARRQIDEKAATLEEMAEQHQIGDQVQVETSQTGFIVRMTNPVAFQLGSANLTPESVEFLDIVAEMIRIGPAEVSVEGHTCNLPASGGPYASNWELSGARAARVVRYLQEQGLENARLAAKSFGEYEPLVPNRDEEARRINRRVEIRVSFVQPVAPPEDDAAPDDETRG